MGHCFSSRSDDDTSKYRRFGIMLVADPDYVLALYPYHTIPLYHHGAGPMRRQPISLISGTAHTSMLCNEAIAVCTATRARGATRLARYSASSAPSLVAHAHDAGTGRA